MSHLTDRLERDLGEIAAGARPSSSAWESIVARLDDDAGSEVELVLAPAPDSSKRLVWPAVAAAALVVIAGSIAVVSRVGDDNSIDMADSDLPNPTMTFVSPTNGFSVEHPDRAVLTPAKATDDWDPGAEQSDVGVDVVETGRATVFKGASTEVPEGSIDAWVDGITPGGCGSTRSEQSQITIDGQPGWIAECPNEIDANVVAGGRIYLFTLLHDRSDARAAFDAFADTIDLTPETAVDPAEPAFEDVLRDNMTATFVSPINGYSFKHVDRGGLEPAKEPWDPANQPPIDVPDSSHIDQFDVVETGLGAFFQSASTKIPEGVAVDAWVDEAVAKNLQDDCYEPRSQQQRITIDGEPGRISQDCPEDMVATVVVDGRLYLFMMAHSGWPSDEIRAGFDAWVDTIDLTPETVEVPSNGA